MSERSIKAKFKRGKLNMFNRTPCGHFVKPRERKKKRNNRIPIIQITDPDLRAACKKAAALFFGKTSPDTSCKKEKSLKIDSTSAT